MVWRDHFQILGYNVLSSFHAEARYLGKNRLTDLLLNRNHNGMSNILSKFVVYHCRNRIVAAGIGLQNVRFKFGLIGPTYLWTD